VDGWTGGRVFVGGYVSWVRVSWAGVKKSCTLPQSAQSAGAGTQIRPSLNHLDAEPCICDVIKVFRQENYGEDFNYQACVLLFFGGGKGR